MQLACDLSAQSHGQSTADQSLCLDLHLFFTRYPRQRKFKYDSKKEFRRLPTLGSYIIEHVEQLITNKDNASLHFLFQHSRSTQLKLLRILQPRGPQQMQQIHIQHQSIPLHLTNDIPQKHKRSIRPQMWACRSAVTPKNAPLAFHRQIAALAAHCGQEVDVLRIGS